MVGRRHPLVRVMMRWVPLHVGISMLLVTFLMSLPSAHAASSITCPAEATPAATSTVTPQPQAEAEAPYAEGVVHRLGEAAVSLDHERHVRRLHGDEDTA